MRSTVLTDDDVRRVLPMSAAVDRIESALREHAEGTLVAPPRFQVDVDKGALGGVAIKHMARPDASRAAILGSGRQARTHLEAAAAVRHFASVKVYSPNATHREAFASEMRDTLDLHVAPVASAQEAVADADVIICVTKSTTPVFDPRWLKPGAHVNTVGPRAQGASELDASIAGRVRVVATDSLRQLRSYATPYFLAATPWMEAMVELGDIVTGK